MHSIKDTTYIRELFSRLHEEDYDQLYELVYGNDDQTINFPEEVTVPEGWEFKAVAVETERNYDSYGYAYTEDGKVIFSVSDGNETVLYKLPCSYASFEGWNIDTDKIAQVTKQEKVVTVYEWVTL